MDSQWYTDINIQNGENVEAIRHFAYQKWRKNKNKKQTHRVWWAECFHSVSKRIESPVLHSVLSAAVLSFRLFVCSRMPSYRRWLQRGWRRCGGGMVVGGGQTLHECILRFHLLIRVTIKIYDMRRMYFYDDVDVEIQIHACRVYHKTDGTNVFRHHEIVAYNALQHLF